MSKNHGGPAFPCIDGDHGMTLRDYFAAAALTGLIAASHSPEGGVDYDDEATTESAYRTADAMLAERDKA